jgi:hypothetical protein
MVPEPEKWQKWGQNGARRLDASPNTFPTGIRRLIQPSDGTSESSDSVSKLLTGHRKL